MPAQVLNRKPIYQQDDHIHIIEKEADFDGVIVKRACIQHPGAVIIVPVLEDGQVILIRQYRLGAEETLLEIPAGTLQPNETPREAAQRELQEEAGYFPETLIEMESFYIMPGISDEVMHLFIARDLHPTPRRLDDDELIEVVPMPLYEALRRVNTNQIRDAKTIIGLLRSTAHH